MAKEKAVEDPKKKPKPMIDGEDIRLAAKKPEKPPADDDAPPPDVDDDPDGGDDDSEESEEPSRLAKKRARFSQLKSSLAEKEKALEAAQRRAELAEVEARMTKQYASGVQSLMQGTQKDPYDAEIERVAAEQNRLVDSFQGRRNQMPAGQDLPPEEFVKFRNEHERLRDRRTELITHKAISSQPKPVTQQDVATKANEVALQQKYPDIMAVPQYNVHAGHLYQAKLLSGIDRDRALDEAVRETRKTFKLKTGPSDVDLQRYGGPPSGMAGPSGNGGHRTVEMTPQMTKMAMRTYPNLEPAAAIKKWQKEVGPKVAEDERLYGR